MDRTGEIQTATLEIMVLTLKQNDIRRSYSLELLDKVSGMFVKMAYKYKWTVYVNHWTLNHFFPCLACLHLDYLLLVFYIKWFSDMLQTGSGFENRPLALFCKLMSQWIKVSVLLGNSFCPSRWMHPCSCSTVTTKNK